MSARLVNIEAGFATKLASATRTAKYRLTLWRKHGGILHALAFDRAAEQQQLASTQFDAAQKLAEAWRK